jgi:uncharacterized protein
MPHARRQVSQGIQRCAGLGAAVLLLCACANSAVLAQSFDCAKASKPVERLICADPALAALDGALGAEVKKALAAAPADRQALLADARRWLAERDKRCPLPAVALTAADRSRAASCLTAAYRERIAALQSKPASGTSPRSSAKTALCQQLANDYKARRKEADDSSPLQILSSGPNPPVTLAQPVMELKPGEPPQAQAAEWAKAQPQPFAFSARVLKDFDEMGEVQRIDRLPGTNLYAASSVQGTALCYTSSFFEVKNGRAEPATGPGSWDNRDGGGCGGATHTFGGIGNTKAAFEESHGYMPSLTSSVTISPWEQGHFGAECTVTFTFAPQFEPHVPDSSAAEESCSGADCEGLRQAALSLAQRIQADFAGVEKAEVARLTSSQRKDYETLKSLAAQAGQTQDAVADADSLLDTAPILLPLVYNGQVYLASVGHFTVGWRIYADWSVKLDRLQDGKPQTQASFAIGMKRGQLIKTAVE